MYTYILSWFDSYGSTCCALFSQQWEAMQHLSNLIDMGRVVIAVEVV